MAERLGGQIVISSLPSYVDACNAVKKLAANVFWAAKTVREKCGALSRATAQELGLLFPEVETGLLEDLSASFQRE